ncbi:MAG: penicillin-binding protein [Actinophytocola sp.]|uniref:penicillin-binding protein n=1 Tax=Actinophytocola sp. TaxID=1872138 RepID=UPI003C757F70
MRVGDGLLKMFGLCLLAGVLMAGMLFPVVGALGVASNRASDTIDSVSADLVATDPPLITRITDSQGNDIAYLYNQYRLPVTSGQISPIMKAAVISIEDRRFYEHHGVDWKGTIRAAISNSSSSDTQGASTLTQQYVKNYLINVVYRDQEGAEEDPEKEIGRQRAQEQSITRKLREARLSIQLEQKMSKEEILTGYLNVVEFTDRVFGVGAAAHAYFHTTPDKLTVSQSAMLAGMVNNPSLYNPWKRADQTLKRRNRVIDTMVETNRLSKEDAEAAKKEPLGVQPNGPDRPPANCVGAGPKYGFFCQYVEDYLLKIGMFSEDQLYSGGYTIKTTFDARATQIAKAAVEHQVPKSTEGIANTMSIVRPGKTRHEVVALVANRDYGLNGDAGQTTISYPYGVMNKFGAGSTYKIFTAAAYLEKGGGINHVIQTPSSHTSNTFSGGAKKCPRTDAPNDGDNRKYCLSNASEGYPKQMTLQQALATSPNTGFVILEETIGMDLVVDMASRLGLRETMATNMNGKTPDPAGSREEETQTQNQYFRPRPNGYPGRASFTLSPAPVSTLEMSNVAATIMSGGVWCPPTPLVEVLDRNGKKLDITKYEEPCEQAVAEPLANSLAQGMSKDDTGSGTSAGAARSFGWTRPMLGKTGTTQDYKSAAFVGATPQLAASTMTFNDGPRPRPICDGQASGVPPRLCGSGSIFGGRAPARTWFEAMGQIHGDAPAVPLPPGDPRYLDGGPESRVPNVVGSSEGDAMATLQQAGYKVAVKRTNRSDPKGTVVNQSPRGATIPGATITIYVSTGYVPPAQTEQPAPPPSGGPPPPSGGTPPPSGGGGPPGPGGGNPPGGRPGGG